MQFSALLKTLPFIGGGLIPLQEIQSVYSEPHQQCDKLTLENDYKQKSADCFLKTMESTRDAAEQWSVHVLFKDELWIY